MKNTIGAFLFFALMLTGLSLSAQSKTDTLRVLTSAQCGQCKDRIERMFAFEKGVVSSELDLESKMVTIVYKPAKTNAENLRKAINQVGYDADSIPANPKAYSKLPPCCKKPDDPEHIGH